MNKIFVGMIAAITLCVIIVVPTRAHEGHPATTAQTVAPRTEVDVEQRTENFRSRLIKEIDRRLHSLHGLQQRVEHSSELSTAHKSAFLAQIETEVKALEALKLEVTAAGSIDALRTYIAKLSTQFKTYSLVVPKANLLRVIDRQLVLVEKLEALATKLQTRIDAAKQQGKNTAKLEQNLTELHQYLGNARQRAQTAELEVAILTPTTVAGDRKILNTHYGDLKSAHKELMAAVRKARDIAQLLATQN